LTQGTLLDTNVLIALTQPDHEHYHKAQEWFFGLRKGLWGVCPLTEAGFIRITAARSQLPGPIAIQQAIAILQSMKAYPDFWYWQIDKSWTDLTAPFAGRISGHQQIIDAYLLGLAIKENGVLVTFDRAIRYLAGEEFAAHLLVLE
jgi:hypothetical protein